MCRRIDVRFGRYSCPKPNTENDHDLPNGTSRGLPIRFSFSSHCREGRTAPLPLYGPDQHLQASAGPTVESSEPSASAAFAWISHVQVAGGSLAGNDASLISSTVTSPPGKARSLESIALLEARSSPSDTRLRFRFTIARHRIADREREPAAPSPETVRLGTVRKGTGGFQLLANSPLRDSNR